MAIQLKKELEDEKIFAKEEAKQAHLAKLKKQKAKKLRQKKRARKEREEMIRYNSQRIRGRILGRSLNLYEERKRENKRKQMGIFEENRIEGLVASNKLRFRHMNEVARANRERDHREVVMALKEMNKKQKRVQENISQMRAQKQKNLDEFFKK